MSEKCFCHLSIDGESYQVKDATARQEIENIKNQIRNINTNKKYIFIGDSYGDGYTTSGTVESWILKTATKLGLVQNETYYKNHFGGVGFANEVEGKTFTTLLSQLNTSITDKQSITDIVVLGGYNDISKTSQEVLTGISTFIQAAKQNYPNAIIHIGEIGWSTSHSDRKKIQKMINECYTKIHLYGAKWIKNIQFSLHNHEWCTDSYGHPNNNGQESISEHLCEYLLTGSTNVHLLASNVSFGNEAYLNISIDDDITLFNHGYVTFNLAEGTALNYSTSIELCDLPLLTGADGSKTNFVRNCVIKTNEGKFINGNILFIIRDKKLRVCLFEANEAGSNYNNVEAIQIQVPGGCEVFNSYDI